MKATTKTKTIQFPSAPVTWGGGMNKTHEPGGGAGLHKTGIRGIQDTRQIVDGKTNDIENNDKKGGSKVQTLNIRELMKKAI